MENIEVHCEKSGEEMIVKPNGNDDVRCVCPKCCRYVNKKLVNLEGTKTPL